jgi:malonate transporter MadL subunit
LVIYGVALLSGCMIAGAFLGDLLGELIGVQANVGGVGIAMLLLVLVSDHLQRAGRLKPVSRQGILFWSSIYIPVVVAMAASQNVLAAVEGGPAALLAGILAVAVGFALVPTISRIGRSEKLDPAEDDPEDGP